MIQHHNDPVYRKTVEILEKQGVHSKAQFIANAIWYYAHHFETGDYSGKQDAQPVNDEYVKQRVMDILSNKAMENQKVLDEKRSGTVFNRSYNVEISKQLRGIGLPL